MSFETGIILKGSESQLNLPDNINIDRIYRNTFSISVFIYLYPKTFHRSMKEKKKTVEYRPRHTNTN